jgi:hypothetical protein
MKKIGYHLPVLAMALAGTLAATKSSAADPICLTSVSVNDTAHISASGASMYASLNGSIAGYGTTYMTAYVRLEGVGDAFPIEPTGDQSACAQQQHTVPFSSPSGEPFYVGQKIPITATLFGISLLGINIPLVSATTEVTIVEE